MAFPINTSFDLWKGKIGDATDMADLALPFGGNNLDRKERCLILKGPLKFPMAVSPLAFWSTPVHDSPTSYRFSTPRGFSYNAPAVAEPAKILLLRYCCSRNEATYALILTALPAGWVGGRL